jgi:hypothetical protein
MIDVAMCQFVQCAEVDVPIFIVPMINDKRLMKFLFASQDCNGKLIWFRGNWAGIF